MIRRSLPVTYTHVAQRPKANEATTPDLRNLTAAT